jgi:serine/threonine-protein kinase
MNESLPWSAERRLDEVCARFEAAWQAAEPDGPPPRIADYLAAVAGPDRHALLRELLRLDVHYRRRRGQSPGADDYAACCPGDAEAVRAALAEASTDPPRGWQPATDAGRTTPEAPRPAAGEPPYPAVPGYDIRGRLGQGGMGEVVRGHDRHMGRELAVKVLLPQYRGVPQLVQRFLAEGRIQGRLQHPGIVPVHELGELPDQRPYFTMKLVEGRTLADLLQERADPTQDLPHLLTVFQQVCQAVAYAHKNGVLHRDLKPANVMVGAFGEVQVMDWGLAKALDRGRGRPAAESEGDAGVDGRAAADGDSGLATQPGAVLGTYAYMAPEQARGEVERLDERADVFGLGAILCEILTGRPPFTGADRDDLANRTQTCDHAEALAALDASGADADLVRLTKGCLAADALERPADAGAVAAALTAYLAGVRERLRAAELERAAAEARAEEEARTRRAAEGQAAAERRSRRLTAGLAAAALLAAGAVGGGGWLVHTKQQEKSAAEGLRQHEAREQMAVQMSEARLLRAQAQEHPLGDPERFRAAQAAAERAVKLAGATEAGERLQPEAEALAEELRAAAAAAEKDRELLRALLEVRAPREGPRFVTSDKGLMLELAEPGADEQFAAAFRAWDAALDVDALATEAAAARLGGRPAAVRDEVVAALDDWAAERRGARPPGDWKRVAALAAALDGGPGKERRAELRGLLAGAALARERALGVLAVALRPVPVPFDAGPGEGRARLRRLAAEADAAGGPVLGLLALARALEEAGEGAEAERLLRAAVRARPREVAPHAALARLLGGRGRWGEALECWSALRTMRPEVGAALADALVSAGRAAEGLALYDLLVAERPNNPWLFFNLGDALLGQGRPKEAEAAYCEARRLNPELPHVHYNLGNTLLRQGRPREAEAAYREAIRLKPNYPQALGNLGTALGYQGRYEEAEVACRDAIRLKPDDAVAQNNLGNALAAQGRIEEAEVAHSEAIRLKPDYPLAHYNLGNALLGRGRYKEAEAAYREALRFKPDYAPAHGNLGNALSRQGRHKEAETAYREALRLQPDIAGAHYNLGSALADQGRDKEAEAPYREAIRLEPDFPEAHCNLGRALMRQGRFAEALGPLRRGHDLGSQRTGWPYPSSDWVRQCERFVELDRKLPAMMRGDSEPASAVERLDLAALCQHPGKQLHAAAARLYAEAFAVEPKLAADLRQPHRYNAACSAALAAAGQGEDAKHLPDKEGQRLRRQVLAWLRDDLALWAKVAERAEAPAKQAVRQTMRHWQQDTDLASVRDPAALDQLLDDEGRQWRQLWNDVAGLLAKVGEK